MPIAVTPPNPNMEFVVLKNDKYVLTPVAFRFLTNIVQAMNGQPTITINDGLDDQQISQFAFGGIVLSVGALTTPEGLLTGDIGDIFISTSGGGGVGSVVYAKEDLDGTSSGWEPLG